MEAVFTLATSYAPGHNFWPGSPFSWWVRGCIAFLLMTGPVIGVWVLVVLTARRWLHVGRWTIAIVLLSLLALETNSLNLRDGDMPWFRGATLGQKTTPWLIVSGIVLLPWAVVARLPGDRRRGFQVLSKPKSRCDGIMSD